jgi:hypothetical protein
MSQHGACGGHIVNSALGFISVERDQVFDLSADTMLKLNLLSDSFWIYVINKYQVISNKSLDISLHFATSYLCEGAFLL